MHSTSATPRALDPRAPSVPHRSWDSELDTRRHLGFSVRISAGLGYGNAHRTLPRGESDVSGMNGEISLELGHTLIEDLILYGRLTGFAFNNVSSEEGQPLSGAYFGAILGGARYHFMPINLYLSGAAGMVAVSVTTDLVKGLNAEPGFTFALEAGKDFWVGTGHDERDVGLGLRFEYARCGTASRGGAWNGIAVSLVFSVGYN